MINKTTITALVIFALLMPYTALARTHNDRTVYETNSLYQYLAVTESKSGGKRYMISSKSGLKQGGIYIKKPGRLLLEYTQMSMVSLAFLEEEPKDVLFVGLGVGAMPGYLSKRYPNTSIDVVEIDPDVLRLAKEYFHFNQNGRINVDIRDGRTFIKRSKKKYDIIYLDAYQGGHIPFHLMTREFLIETKRLLKDGGIVVSNLLSKRKNKLFFSMLKTYEKEFKHVYKFQGEDSYNNIFVAATQGDRKSRIEVVKRARKIKKQKDFDILLDKLAERLFYHNGWTPDGTKVLTDDFAPVNLYRHMESRGSVPQFKKQ